MNKRDNANFLHKHGQLIQGDTLSGPYKGVVVDNRDPLQLFRARIHIYGLHSDYKDLYMVRIPWAEPMDKVSSAPSRFAKVWVMFEGGDLETPVYFGRWSSIPAGRGKLPFNKREGSEIPPWARSSNNLVPESTVLGYSEEGSAVWISEKLLGDEKGIASSINLVDTGSKYFRISSLHIDAEPWVPADSRVAEQKKTLEDEEGEPFERIRDGHSEPVDAAGSIELGFSNLSQSWCTSKDKQTAMVFSQTQEEGEGEVEIAALDAQILALRQQSAQFAMMGDALFLGAPNGILMGDCLQPPTRWD